MVKFMDFSGEMLQYDVSFWWRVVGTCPMTDKKFCPKIDGIRPS